MRIELKVDGGLARFPGLAKPLVIETGSLPEGEAAELERLVEGARFFDLPVRGAGPLPGAADYRRYTITVMEEGGRRHTVEALDPVEDPMLRGLLDHLQARARRR